MNSTNVTPQVVDEHVAAKLLTKSVHTLRNERFLKRGCPYVRMGRSIRYLVTDINAYLLRNRIDPEKAA